MVNRFRWFSLLHIFASCFIQIPSSPFLVDKIDKTSWVTNEDPSSLAMISKDGHLFLFGKLESCRVTIIHTMLIYHRWAIKKEKRQADIKDGVRTISDFSRCVQNREMLLVVMASDRLSVLLDLILNTSPGMWTMSILSRHGKEQPTFYSPSQSKETLSPFTVTSRRFSPTPNDQNKPENWLWLTHMVSVCLSLRVCLATERTGNTKRSCRPAIWVSSQILRFPKGPLSKVSHVKPPPHWRGKKYPLVLHMFLWKYGRVLPQRGGQKRLRTFAARNS